MTYTPIPQSDPGTGTVAPGDLTGFTVKRIPFGSAATALEDVADLTYDKTTHDLSLSVAESGGTVGTTLTNTSNTASSDARDLINSGGTSAGDAVSQIGVSGGQQYSYGVDNSVSGDPFVFSVGTALGTTDVYSINASGEMNIGTGIPVSGEKLRVRTAGDTDVGFETTTTSAKTTIKAIAGALSARLVQQGSTAAGTTNAINNTSLTLVQTSAGSIMMTAPDSTSILYFAVNGAVKGQITNQRLLLANRLNQAKGADVASASTLTLGIDGDSFTITGTTNVDYITTTNWSAGARVLLQFSGILTVNNNSGSVPGSTASILLTAAFITTANDTLSLWFNGTNWVETGRTVI